MFTLIIKHLFSLKKAIQSKIKDRVEVVVVGSYARGTQTPESDVDVVVVVLNVVYRR
ncbi:MAG: hypothetical protein DRP82_01915 [Planctomycetota bacterium]|nr:MAG: hypothetical protein DRP82_01915 [Planctomycetota bacterium]